MTAWLIMLSTNDSKPPTIRRMVLWVVAVGLVASSPPCPSRTDGRLATTPIKKMIRKCCDRILAVRVITGPMRKSLSAKRADIVVFVMKGPFELVLVGVGPEPWSDANANGMPHK